LTLIYAHARGSQLVCYREPDPAEK